MPGVTKGKTHPRPENSVDEAPVSPETEELKTILGAMPGAFADPVPMPRGAPAPAVMYKLMGKMFAILSIRGDAFVIVKCNPDLVEILRQKYRGIGHRSHLDRRFWISIELNADVPPREIRKLIEGSYDLIHAGLTRKQKEQLGGRFTG